VLLCPIVILGCNLSGCDSVTHVMRKKSVLVRKCGPVLDIV